MKWKKSGTFKQTAQFQRMYLQLIACCTGEGTMVMQDREIENDKDISPYLFYRKGTIEYVFPQQKVELAEDKSIDYLYRVPTSVGYHLWTEVQKFSFDKSQVLGKIRIEYQDARNRPELAVADLLEHSELPEEVRRTIEDIFEV